MIGLTLRVNMKKLSKPDFGETSISIKRGWRTIGYTVWYLDRILSVHRKHSAAVRTALHASRRLPETVFVKNIQVRIESDLKLSDFNARSTEDCPVPEGFEI